MNAPPARPAGRRIESAARVRTMARRRRQIWVNIALFLLVTALMLVVSVAQRDHDSRRGCFQRLAHAQRELQRLWDEQGLTGPTELPLPPAPGASDGDPLGSETAFDLRQHYAYNTRYRYSAKSPVAVCYCAEPHSFYLHGEGRHVLTFTGGSYELIWMSEADFQSRSEEWGIRPGPDQPAPGRSAPRH